MDTIINVNVGGVIYTTSKTTLTKCHDSMLAAMFTGNMQPSDMDKDGNYFIDRDGQLFVHILNFLRSGQLLLPDNFNNMHSLVQEAEFFQIKPLINALRIKLAPKIPERRDKYIGIIETERVGLEDWKNIYSVVPTETMTGSASTFPTMFLHGRLNMLRRLSPEILSLSKIKEKYLDFRDPMLFDDIVPFRDSYKRSYLAGLKGTIEKGKIYTDDINHDETRAEPWCIPGYFAEEPEESDTDSLIYEGHDDIMKVDEYLVKAGWDLLRHTKYMTEDSDEKSKNCLLQLWALPADDFIE